MVYQISLKELTILISLMGFVLAQSSVSLANQSGPGSGTQQNDNAKERVEEVVILGSRVKARSSSDSPVPIDVIAAEDFSRTANATDITDNLRTQIPSYSATPWLGNAGGFVRATSLRGLSPDQTLVLINGKRRHRSALIQVGAPSFGKGAHAPDVGMIPSVALQRVEVLRDGAAAQYGSDAIAGVINFVTNDDAESGSVEIQYGQYYEGEQSVKVAANAGFSLFADGFINLSLEHTDNEALSRGFQNEDAQAAIDQGSVGVGQDSPFDDAPLAQTLGRPQAKATRFFLNSGVSLSDNAEWYLQGNYAKTDGVFRFFYRDSGSGNRPSHSTIQGLVDNFGYTGSLLQTGYAPHFIGAGRDFSLLTGARGLFGADSSYDISLGFGQNELALDLNNTVNASLGLGSDGEPAQRDFFTGADRQEELTLTADFSTPLSSTINLAYGAEWREETYTRKAGEPNSYLGGGGSGFGGTTPASAGEWVTDNVAVYVDLEHDINSSLFVQYAFRYEDFSSFGDTSNGKLAMRWSVNDNFIIRAAASSGFHSPTSGQANLQSFTTELINDSLVTVGLLPSTSPVAITAGGGPLTEEKSLNYSMGFVASTGEKTSLTIDLYQIDIDDKIFRVNEIPHPDNVPGAPPQEQSFISFYTNALDVQSKGIDLVLTSGFDWGERISTNITFAYNYTKIGVTGRRAVSGIIPVSDDEVDDIEDTLPNHRFVLTSNTYFGDNSKWNVMLRANYHGRHVDARGSQHAPVRPSLRIDPVIYVDMELGYDFSEKLHLVLGGSNVFNSFVNETNANTFNFLRWGIQYPHATAANYEGGSWYFKAKYKF